MNTQQDILGRLHGFVGKSARQGGACRSPAIRNPLVRAEPAVARQSAIGFTLVELLVIVGIIALLVGILLPALNKFTIASQKAKTQAAINLIDGACRHYFTDFDDYPPSHDSNYSGWTGSELIVLFLTGYGPDDDDDGIPDVANLDTDDGVDGYGFRVRARQHPYHGPYNGVEKLSVRKGGNECPEFVDTFGTFGNPILYYCWTGSNYSSVHNTDGPADVNYYAKDAAGSYYRSDFILISRGLNEDWNAPQDGDSDDVTNFFNE